MALIKLDKITKQYGTGSTATPVLKDISLEINKGDFVAIMGPSGSGKSTLMNIIGLLDVPTAGEYTLEGKDTAHLSSIAAAKLRRNRIGFIFQSFNLLPRQHAIENIMLPMVYTGESKLDREHRAHELLEKVGLTERGYYRPNQLSGGQKQRVAIARALANNPSIVLADEPTGNLDTVTGKQIMKLLLDLNETGHTIIIVTHDEHVAAYAHRQIRIVDGEVQNDSGSAKNKEKAEEKESKPEKKHTIEVKKVKK